MKMSDILARVRYLIDDPSYPTTPELVDLINIGRREIAKDALCIESEQYYGTSLLAEDQIIAMSGDMFKIQTINYMDNRPNPLEPVTVRDLNATRVQSKQSKPYWYLEEDRKVTLLPYMAEDYKSSVFELSGDITASQNSLDIIFRYTQSIDEGSTYDMSAGQIDTLLSGDIISAVVLPTSTDAQHAYISLDNLYEFDEPTVINQVILDVTHTLTSSLLIGTDIKFSTQYTLYGSNDNIAWTSVSTFVPNTTALLDVFVADNTYSFPNRTPYLYYKITVAITETFYNGNTPDLTSPVTFAVTSIIPIQAHILELCSALPVDGYIRIGSEDIRYFGNTASVDSLTARLYPIMRGYNKSTAAVHSAYTPVYELDTVVKYYELPEDLHYTTLSGAIVTNDDIEPVFATDPDTLAYYCAWQSKIKDLDDVSMAINYQEQFFHNQYLTSLSKLKMNSFVSRDTPRAIRML